ncbi:MAG TPA: L-seryl-tRNA(Sec) selenium transferase [Ktedonobacteraceae bacterium]|nr:L-seryl-tRNA(Sec) selenium transferase [Ktedonobacteraceae bacterium]
MNVDQEQLRLLPSVDELLHSSSGQRMVERYSRSMTLQALRTSIAQARANIRHGAACPSSDEILKEAEHNLDKSKRPNLQPVINATGVIINTNLGRSPLSQEALHAVQWVAGGYSNLEYELETGERGSRHSHVSTLLCELTGAEAALVTNNNAAAVLLALSVLAAGNEVIISRGQLVEIGGGFRVPEVMSQSGCKLIEVGTTNRTRPSDYEAAITERTALLLTVHPSNFQIVGFTESTPVEAMAELAHQHGLLLMDDLGSGCMLASERYGLRHEPMPQESIAAGVDVVCFSGDKLLGGPQAGILVGKAAALKRISKHPLMRAVRIDKMTLAALEATLRHYRRAEAETRIPIWRMIAASQRSIAGRAANWVSTLQQYGIPARMQRGESTVGGGSLPGETLPTTLLALDAGNVSMSLDELAKRLRLRSSPLIVRILRDALLVDPRTVLEEQDNEIVQAFVEELGRERA